MRHDAPAGIFFSVPVKSNDKVMSGFGSDKEHPVVWMCDDQNDG